MNSYKSNPNRLPLTVLLTLLTILLFGQLHSGAEINNASGINVVEQKSLSTPGETTAVLVPREQSQKIPGAHRVNLASNQASQISPTELKTVLESAGFTGESLVTAWGLVMRESRGFAHIVGAVNPDGTHDYGLFQINDTHRSHVDFTRIFDPEYNASVAYQLSNQGTDFSAWGVGSSGWAGTLERRFPKTWKTLQKNLSHWTKQYPG